MAGVIDDVGGELIALIGAMKEGPLRRWLRGFLFCAGGRRARHEALRANNDFCWLEGGYHRSDHRAAAVHHSARRLRQLLSIGLLSLRLVQSQSSHPYISAVW